jgi:hypothetical protein
MNTSEFTQSRGFKITLIVIAALVVFLGGLSLGEHVGFHKASFDFQNGNNFYRTFGSGGGPGMQPMEFSDPNATVGKVVSVTLPTITIEDRDNTEKTIVVDSQTAIRHLRDSLTPQDIIVGDYVVAIGEPNAQSQIAAVLIRILPPPMDSANSAQVTH